MQSIDAAQIDPEAVEAFLRDRFGRGIDAVTPLAGGAWSEAFAFRLGDRDLVVRSSAIEAAFRKDEAAARHASPALPIPAILEIGETPTGFYAISERRFGTVLETVDEAQMRALLPSIMETLDAIRLADIRATSGYGGWAPDGRAPHTTWGAALLDINADPSGHHLHGWRERLASSPTGDRPFLEAYEQLLSLAPLLPDDRHLIHSDLLNRNVLVEEDRIAAVFDWGSSMYGDFLARPRVDLLLGSVVAGLSGHRLSGRGAWALRGYRARSAAVLPTPAGLPALDRPRRPDLSGVQGPLGRSPVDGRADA